MALVLTANRHTHKAYIKCRENNFSLNGLMGVNLYGKTAGIVGTGKIGLAMARICQGFGMKIVAYDLYPNESSGLEYVSLDRLLAISDLISLHCPLTPETHHMINKKYDFPDEGWRNSRKYITRRTDLYRRSDHRYP